MRSILIRFFSALALLVCLFGTTSSSAVEVSFPNYIGAWSTDLKRLLTKNDLKFVSASTLERLLLDEVSLDNFEATCVSLLQKTVKRFVMDSNEWEPVSLDSALEMCTLVNPWNSMECSGVTGVLSSYARSIQEFVNSKQPTNGDLRAACLLTTAIAPSRPFSPIAKGSIKKKCDEVCSGEVGRNISSIDTAFCSRTLDLCKAVDFTLYSAFNTLTEKHFGVASAVSILLSEGVIGLRTTFREGCRFVLSMIQKSVFPSSSSSVSNKILQPLIAEFYKTKLQEVGITGSDLNVDKLSSESTLLSVVSSQISDAIKIILEGKIEPKNLRLANEHAKSNRHQIRPHTSSEVSPISIESQIEDTTSEFRETFGVSESGYSAMSDSKSLSIAQKDWFDTIYRILHGKTKDINLDLQEDLREAVSNFDSTRLYSSCVSELRRSRLASNRKIADACRSIDPFSNIKCQKLNNFELLYLIMLKEELESSSDGLIIDLRDLCAISNKMSLKSFIKSEAFEISGLCIDALRGRLFKNKYHTSYRTIKRACEKTDYFRYSACGDIASSHGNSHKLSLVLSIASNLFRKRDEKERLQLIRSSVNNFPSYVDICSSVSNMHDDSTDECVFALRESLRKFQTGIFDIEGACMMAMSGTGIHPLGYQTYRPGIEHSYPYGYDYYPGDHLPRYYGTRRYYKDIQSAPLISSLPWSLSSLPEELRYTGRYIRQQYSDSRKGYYKSENGKIVYHDGIRYRLNGLWFVKIGDDWYIDRSDSYDFIELTPGDYRYNRFLASLYQKVPPQSDLDTIPLYRRVRHDTFGYTPVPYTTTGPYGYSYLQDIYGKPGTSVRPGFSPFAYKRCKKCNSWTPYTHFHDDESDKGVEVTTVEGPRFEGLDIVTTKTDYDPYGRVVRTKKTYHGDSGFIPGLSNTRTVGTQTHGVGGGIILGARPQKRTGSTGRAVSSVSTQTDPIHAPSPAPRPPPPVPPRPSRPAPPPPVPPRPSVPPVPSRPAPPPPAPVPTPAPTPAPVSQDGSLASQLGYGNQIVYANSGPNNLPEEPNLSNAFDSPLQ